MVLRSALEAEIAQMKHAEQIEYLKTVLRVLEGTYSDADALRNAPPFVMRESLDLLTDICLEHTRGRTSRFGRKTTPTQIASLAHLAVIGMIDVRGDKPETYTIVPSQKLLDAMTATGRYPLRQ